MDGLAPLSTTGAYFFVLGGGLVGVESIATLAFRQTNAQRSFCIFVAWRRTLRFAFADIGTWFVQLSGPAARVFFVLGFAADWHLIRGAYTNAYT